eukprot:scaffold129248_cov15-Tisochrysis_lutea.AAC.1
MGISNRASASAIPWCAQFSAIVVSYTQGCILQPLLCFGNCKPSLQYCVLKSLACQLDARDETQHHLRQAWINYPGFWNIRQDPISQQVGSWTLPPLIVLCMAMCMGSCKLDLALPFYKKTKADLHFSLDWSLCC